MTVAAQPSASALIRVRVARMPSRSSPVNLSTPPSTASCSRSEIGVIPSGVSRRWVTPGAARGGLQGVGPDHAVVQDPEREVAVRLEPHDLRPGRPHLPARAVDVERAGAEAHRPAHERPYALRAPGRHPRQVGDQRPHPLGGGGDVDGLVQGSDLGHRPNIPGVRRRRRDARHATAPARRAPRARSTDLGSCHGIATATSSRALSRAWSATAGSASRAPLARPPSRSSVSARASASGRAAPASAASSRTHART